MLKRQWPRYGCVPSGHYKHFHPSNLLQHWEALRERRERVKIRLRKFIEINYIYWDSLKKDYRSKKWNMNSNHQNKTKVSKQNTESLFYWSFCSNWPITINCSNSILNHLFIHIQFCLSFKFNILSNSYHLTLPPNSESFGFSSY